MKGKTKKVFDIISKVVMWLVVALTFAMMIFTIVSVTTLDKSDRGIFGYKFLIVQSDSMSESDKNADLDIHFKAGDIIIVKNPDDAYALKEGEVISFISTNSVSYGETVTHMIRSVKTNSNGNVVGYVTYGTNTGVDDEALVEPGYVIGQYVGKIPEAGNFFAFLKTTPGYVVCILIPFSVLILYNGGNVISLLRKYKKEQSAALAAEREKIETERMQNEKMLLELQELKAQLERQREENALQKAVEKPNEEVVSQPEVKSEESVVTQPEVKYEEDNISENEVKTEGAEEQL